MRALFGLALLLLATAAAAEAQHAACAPCVGVVTDDPAAVAQRLRGALPEDATLMLKWRVELAASPGELPDLGDRALRPWIAVVFRTPPPLLSHLEELEAELRALAALVRRARSDTRLQLLWEPAGGGTLGEEPASAREYAFLVKRAAVAVTGALPEAPVFSAPLPAREDFVRGLFGEDTAAYLDGIALRPEDGDAIHAMKGWLDELDPGTELAVDARPQPSEPLETLALAAADSTRGASLTLFRLDAYEPEQLDSILRPILLLAREFRGDLSPDPYSRPRGAAEAWSFVRGEDLGLRVVVRSHEPTLDLEFPDPSLRTPALLDPGGEEQPVFGARRTRTGLHVPIDPAPAVFVLKLERARVSELERGSVEERVEVEDVRQMPVSEILRRLQAFEDAQARRLLTYIANNSTSLRFQLAQGVQSLDTTFRGAFFFRQGGGFDWAWQELLINGVAWRKRIPKIPLIQPEKAAAMPADITFTQEYRYRLRGTGEAQGRDCWVIDFEPAVAVEPGRPLWQGTVWVDREVYSRVKSRAVQLGLEGEVLSNEETLFFTPLDDRGQAAEWGARSFVLPLRSVGQQLFSLLDTTVVVEREVLLSDLVINPEDFDDRLRAVLDSETTMVRDTEAGLRYLIKDKDTGERLVEAELDPNRLFLLGGVLYDESLDFPVPLGGVNWLSFDFRGTGTQANLFFAGALVTLDLASPKLFGSKFTGGIDAFALAFAGTDTVFRDGVETPAEDVDVRRPNIDLSLGRPMGSFFKLDFEYSLAYNDYGRSDDTDPAFVVPVDHLSHAFSLIGRYNRRGYRFRVAGTHVLRSDWEPWGLPGNPDFTPDQKDYQLWGGSIAKTWHLAKFRKVGAEIEYVGGEGLDRFSKYGFGPFSDIRVRGYRSDLVRAEEAWGLHLTYGLDLGSLLRVDVLGDLALASDQLAGLQDELLGGVGIAGTFIGPWRTVVQVDLGQAVTGPDDGFTALVAFLKLFG